MRSLMSDRCTTEMCCFDERVFFAPINVLSSLFTLSLWHAG